jgi:hypothetical protein
MIYLTESQVFWYTVDVSANVTFPSTSAISTDCYSNIWAPEEQKETIKVRGLISINDQTELNYSGYYYTLRSIRTTTGDDVYRASAAYTTTDNGNTKEEILTIARLRVLDS